MTQAFEELKDWLTERKKMETAIDEDIDLIEQGILDSLLFAEYIMMIEDLSGVEIDVDEELLERVKTLSLVRVNYFQSQAQVAQA